MVKIIPSTDPLFREYDTPESYEPTHEERSSFSKSAERRKSRTARNDTAPYENEKTSSGYAPPFEASHISSEELPGESTPRFRPDTNAPRTGRRTKSPQSALQSLMALCAKSEKSLFDARQALLRWGVAPPAHEEILATLLREGFIDERRYAAAYVREKGNLSHWGIHKIRAALRGKRIPEETIAEALTQLETMNLGEKLKEMLRKKTRSTRAKNSYDLRAKLMRFGTAQGFDYAQVSELLDELIGEAQQPDDF